MKTVPSLIASSTVGVAAVGLALGKQESPRPFSKRRRVGDKVDPLNQTLDRSSLISRPGTSLTFLIDDDEYSTGFFAGIPTTPSTKSHRRPPLPQMDTHAYSDKQTPLSVQPLNAILPDEIPIDDSKRESLSSRGSWMKRLSTLPLSYSNTSEASTNIDSSLRSNSYSAKTLSPASKPVLQFRNRLVKRNQSASGSASGPDAPQRFRSKFTTIRRPATSHQRSVLQQQHFEELPGTRRDYPADSCLNLFSLPGENSDKQSPFTWHPYFEAKPLLNIMGRTPSKVNDEKNSDHIIMSKRVFIDKNTSPTLIKPGMIENFKPQDLDNHDFESYNIEEPSTEAKCHSTESEIRRSQGDMIKAPQRSYSMQFGSSIPWLSRSDSFRGPKKDANSRVRSRCSSVPLCAPSSLEKESPDGVIKKKRTALCLSMFYKERSINTKADNLTQPISSDHKIQTQSCPIEFLSVSQLSSLYDDLARFGLSSSSAAIHSHNSHHSSPTSQVIEDPHTPFSSTIYDSFATASCFPTKDPSSSNLYEVIDRASTLIGSDADFKGVIADEEDDTDFQSETVFDSMRSGVTDSIRSHNPLLDCIFDESPSILDKYQKYKRFSVHEMLNSEQYTDLSKKIEEESECKLFSSEASGLPTLEQQEFCTPVCGEKSINGAKLLSSVISANEPDKSLHLDDDDDVNEDEDEDWTKDEEFSEVEKKEISPGCRKLNAGYSSNAVRSLVRSEAPKNNVFDWSEPSSLSRFGFQDGSSRPRTAHVKQLTDGRGGRPLGRRGPSALHIRSQSVPVVPDLDTAKLTSKFGTWGLGSKGISEDWDGDFEFDNVDPSNMNEGEISGLTSGVLVPEAIQASQKNIAGHVGQIREVCLLVEDLKRLRVLGKSQGLLDGEYASLWQQAEGIIALAAPVEDEKIESDSPLTSSSQATSVFSRSKQSKSLGDRGKPSINTSDQTTNIYDPSNESPPSRHRKSVPLLNDGNPGASPNIQDSPKDFSRPSFPLTRNTSGSSSTEVARKVMESMHQQRSSSDPLMQNFVEESGTKMPFDTTTLKDLVHRAAILSRTLGDAVRAADGQSSCLASARELESSPAFTRVFTDPTSTSPKNLPRSQSKNSILSNSIDIPPQRGLPKHMHMMAVI